MTLSTYDKILDVAQSLVVAGGYNGFSYADISDAVGVRKASIHHHFPTKANLVAALVKRYVQRTGESLDALRAHFLTPSEQLDAYVAYWQKCVVDGTQPFCVCAMLASEMPLVPDEVALEVRVHFENLATWLAVVLKEGAQQGAFWLDASPENEAQMFMASVHGALLSARAFGDAQLFLAIMEPQVTKLRT